MKNLIKTIALILFLSPFVSKAQGPDNRKENIEAFRVAFFTRQVGFTPDEAKKFWPFYNEMQIELDKLHKERRSKFMFAKENLDEMTDKEVDALVDYEMSYRQRELDIEKKYNEKYRSVLSARKMLKLYRTEELFKRELLKKIQEQRN